MGCHSMSVLLRFGRSAVKSPEDVYSDMNPVSSLGNSMEVVSA